MSGSPDLLSRRAELVSRATVEPESPNDDNANAVDTVLEATLGQLSDVSDNAELERVLVDFGTRAAALTPVQRPIARAAAIKGLKALGVDGPAGLVDGALKAYAHTNGVHDTNVGQPVAFADPEPWSDPVDGA